QASDRAVSGHPASDRASCARPAAAASPAGREPSGQSPSGNAPSDSGAGPSAAFERRTDPSSLSGPSGQSGSPALALADFFIHRTRGAGRLVRDLLLTCAAGLMRGPGAEEALASLQEARRQLREQPAAHTHGLAARHEKKAPASAHADTRASVPGGHAQPVQHEARHQHSGAQMPGQMTGQIHGQTSGRTFGQASRQAAGHARGTQSQGRGMGMAGMPVNGTTTSGRQPMSPLLPGMAPPARRDDLAGGQPAGQTGAQVAGQTGVRADVRVWEPSGSVRSLPDAMLPGSRPDSLAGPRPGHSSDSRAVYRQDRPVHRSASALLPGQMPPERAFPAGQGGQDRPEYRPEHGPGPAERLQPDTLSEQTRMAARTREADREPAPTAVPDAGSGPAPQPRPF
ncbi:MAG: hypothetical protein Q4F72_10370, partial [Desulfovibrionaceae bacterium]|nr:hypothetical protein [Desulfovibrionaceae bacterium]